jgi:hypothetical protein
MTEQHQAAPELWAAAEKWGANTMDMANCLLELRDRIEALEATQQPPRDKLDRLIALDRDEPRAALAQPEPVAPKDEEIEEAAKLIYASMRLAVPGKYHTTDWVKRGNSLMQDEARRAARAVYDFARHGTPTIQPVPVSERLPEPEDWDTNGRCWMFDPCDRGWWAYRSALPSDDELGRPPWTHWLPHNALPTPDTTND